MEDGRQNRNKGDKIVKSTPFNRVLTDVPVMLPSLGYKTKYR